MAMAGEIVAFDVETTGLSPHRGHRVIEIGAVRISSERKQRIINRLL
jgi:DNA polymerase III epsilon subunit-like protein